MGGKPQAGSYIFTVVDGPILRECGTRESEIGRRTEPRDWVAGDVTRQAVDTLSGNV